MVLVVWDNWGEHVCRQLSSFLIGSSLSDVTISVGMKSIRTHRIILSFFSSYFKEMLDDIHEECPVIVVFPEVNFQALKIIIAYMYQGQVCKKSIRVGVNQIGCRASLQKIIAQLPCG
ncbi:hypothetical protein SK128_022814 [Halocaridina rubra]|uniref:BTB domain-containing protein n=1 Tax=Halocaridina rubra TaxID=373956 RepID=A0AAN9AEF8_HALRR